MNNLFDAIPESLPHELIETILSGEHVRIERIISHGHTSAEGFWYEQDEHEFVLLLEGEAEIEFIDHTLRLNAGDYLMIEAGKRHRVKWTTKDRATIWLAIFYS